MAINIVNIRRSGTRGPGSEVLQPLVIQAQSSAASAAIASSLASSYATSIPSTREDIDKEIADRIKAAEVVPDWSPTRDIVVAGNSISGITGSTLSTSDAITELIAAGASTSVVNHYQVGAGTNMAEALAYLTANMSTPDKARDLVLTDPIAGEKLTPGTRREDFWSTDDVFNDLEAIQALLTGDATVVVLMVASPADTWSGTTGNAKAAYTRFKERAMAQPYSADIVDVRQHMIDWYSARTGFEALQAEWNEAPLSTLGCQATPVDLRQSHSPLTVENPLTNNHYEGEPITPNAAFNNAGLYQHSGAFGAGSNVLADQVHPNALGRRIMARIVRDHDLGKQGFAPFIPAGHRFRTTSDVAEASSIGTVRMRGEADEVAISSGDPLGSFAVINKGLDANGYGSFTIVRTGSSQLDPGEHKLLITARKGEYSRSEFVRVMVMAASGDRVPTLVNWDTPICFSAPRTSINVSDCRKISYLVDMTIGDLSATRYLSFFTKGGSEDRIFLSVQTTGRIEFQAYNSSNTLVCRAVSRSDGFGGPIVTEGARFTLLLAVDWENGLVNGRLNGADLLFSGTGTTFSSTNSAVNLTDTTPLFLASQVPFGLLGQDAIPSGSLNAIATYPGTYLDCAAVESSVINGNGDFILDDETFTLGGAGSHAARVRGPVADLFGGGQDSSMVVIPTWRPSNITDQVVTSSGAYLSPGNNLSDLSDAGISRNNLGLGSLAQVDDAPSDGNEYVRKNNLWAVASGGGGSGGLLAAYPPVTGEYLINALSVSSVTNITLSANQLYLLPLIPLANNLTLAALAVSVTTASAGASIRLGIYPAGSNGRPDGESPLADVELSGAAVADVEGAVSLTLNAGTPYWLALITDGTPAVRAIPSTVSLPLVANSGSLSQIRNRLTAGQAYGPLPTCPSTSTTVSNLPIIGLKAG